MDCRLNMAYRLQSMFYTDDEYYILCNKCTNEKKPSLEGGPFYIALPANAQMHSVSYVYHSSFIISDNLEAF